MNLKGVPNPGCESFGECYAVLNLDLMTLLVDAVKDSTEGQSFISNCIAWNDAVHKKIPKPLTIFTTLYFSTAAQPELARQSPFSKVIDGVDGLEKGSTATQIDPRFAFHDGDIVLQKTRWYAGAGNSLEQILKTQNTDTVIISGLTISGVVMSTLYHLFDLDYNVYLILDNVMELPGGAPVSKESLVALLEKMHFRAISLEEALQILAQS